MTDARVRHRKIAPMALRRTLTARCFGAALLGVAAVFAAGPSFADENTGAAVTVALDAPQQSATPSADSGGSGEQYGDYAAAHPANYDFAFVSVGAYQNWAIAGRVLYFGIGGGVGPPLFRYSKLGTNTAGMDPSLEIVYANAYLRLKPVPYVDLDVGPKVAITSALWDVDRAPQAGLSYGGYVDLRFGSRTVKFGPRFEYDRVAYFDQYQKGWRLTPIMLRVEH